MIFKPFHIFILMVVAVPATARAVVIWEESFETDGDGLRYIQSSDFRDSADDYFTRTDQDTVSISTQNGPYTGQDGDWLFAAEDVNDDGGNGQDVQTLTFTVDTSDYMNLQLTGLFGAAGGASYDATDYIHITYRIDDGASSNLMWFELFSDGDTVNSASFRRDMDFDGEGDVSEANLGATLTSYTADIAGIGDTLELVVEVRMNSGDEEVAFDQLQILGNAIPEPTSLLLMVLSSCVMLRRRH